METARLIVCERTGRWALALRRCMTHPGTEFCETRSLPEARMRLQESPESLLLMECSTRNWQDRCQWLLRQTIDFPQLRTIALADPALRAAECVVRTAGAHQVVFSLMELLDMSCWISRHFEQIPHREQGVREWIWHRIPWSRR